VLDRPVRLRVGSLMRCSATLVASFYRHFLCLGSALPLDRLIQLIQSTFMLRNLHPWGPCLRLAAVMVLQVLSYLAVMLIMLTCFTCTQVTVVDEPLALW